MAATQTPNDPTEGLVNEYAFETAGLGRGPFRCIGLFSIPSQALAAANPDAYNNALAQMPRGFGCGTCAFCGQAIMNCYLIRAACGATFSVGCDCVAKTGEAKLIKAADLFRKRADRKAREEARAAKMAARHAEWAAQRAEREAAEQVAAEARRVEREGKRAECTAANAWLIDVLRGKTSSPFANDMAAKLETARFADAGLSPRAIAIIRDIYGKHAHRTEGHNRANSKAYAAAVAEFDAKIANP